MFIKRKCCDISVLSKIKTIKVKIDIYRFPHLNTIHISQRLCRLGLYDQLTYIKYIVNILIITLT
jgi:hypothetical protein